MISIAVAGASGYAGGEALRLLLNHPGYGRDFTIGALTGASNAGQRFGDLVPGLPQLADRTVEPTTEEVLGAHDVAILGLPHGVSSSLDLGDTVVLDCGADRRLVSRDDWDTYYGGEWPGSWPYGIPELPGNREILRKATGVAVPGCFPTGATLALTPAMHAGLMDPKVSRRLGHWRHRCRQEGRGEHARRRDHVQPALLQGRHPPAHPGDGAEHPARPARRPPRRGPRDLHPGPRPAAPRHPHHRHRGRPRHGAGDPCRLRGLLRRRTLLHLLPEGEQPEVKSVVGTNMCHLQVTVVDGVVVATSAIDNLTKGTAGAAVQCLNIIQGWDETAGLPMAGL
jgi:N-acetyl-gamma-glutamyl-phosphate reductase